MTTKEDGLSQMKNQLQINTDNLSLNSSLNSSIYFLIDKYKLCIFNYVQRDVF